VSSRAFRRAGRPASSRAEKNLAGSARAHH